jgi:hypothetical protein
LTLVKASPVPPIAQNSFERQEALKKALRTSGSIE